MSLYNMVAGYHPTARVVLDMLELSPDDCGRFRDAYITEDGELAIFTRNGGGNRDDYQSVIDTLAEHPNYLRDEDDDFDSTYCTIFFSVPDKEDAIESVQEYLKLVEKEGKQDMLDPPLTRFQKNTDTIVEGMKKEQEEG